MKCLSCSGLICWIFCTKEVSSLVQVEQADLRIISHSLSKITKSRSQNQEVTSIHLTNRSVDVQHKSSINLHPNLLNLNVFCLRNLTIFPQFLISEVIPVSQVYASSHNVPSLPLICSTSPSIPPWFYHSMTQIYNNKLEIWSNHTIKVQTQST